ncbi:MAG TPA: AMP-binding protein, partial [Gaiellaceae bacterium]|nr:AMP-binding protein [Gaiellaceae bacterium]
PERVAVDEDDRRTTYAELDERSDRLASALLGLGLSRGDLVATLSGSSGEHVVAFFACAKAGLGLVPLNWRLAPAELAFQLDDSRPAVFLVEPQHAELADEALRHASADPQRHELGAELGGHGAPAEEPQDEDPLLVVYTSGTTGRPKGAVLTHANCFWTNLSFDLATGVHGDDVVLQVLPQFHCGGWNVQPLLAWWKGATVVLERAFDPARCLDLIERKRVTTMMGVPANYQFMAQEPAFASTDLSSLARVVVGGAPMPQPVLDAWQERGVTIVQGYGLTEAAPNVIYAGRPYPYVELALRDPSSGELLDGAATGELLVRGPNVFAGYLRRPDETAAAFVDGWLRTGDVAERSGDGSYRIRDRLKEMYISGGENVYPAEVETALHEHPAVSDVAVVAVPDERWGEAGVAFVVAAAEVTADELREFCRERLAHYKVPREIRFVDALPRSAMNKVLKDELAASLEPEAVA